MNLFHNFLFKFNDLLELNILTQELAMLNHVTSVHIYFANSLLDSLLLGVFDVHVIILETFIYFLIVCRVLI